jgi:putative transcriptional regulator
MIVLFRAILIVTTVAMWCDVTSAAEMEANAIFLVARPEMADTRFRETVVLVTQPRQGGPWGVIVNKPLEQRLADIFTEHESLRQRKDTLFFGGPVMPDGLVFLVRATKPSPRSIPVLNGVYFTGDPDWIDELLKRPDPTRGLRVYSGYSGWAASQLQAEMARGDWHVVPADAETIFDKDPARIWPELIQRAGAKQTKKDEEAVLPSTLISRQSILDGSPLNSWAQGSPP